MYIKNLDIKGFGKLKDMSITFEKGLNLIYGSNESGKSTLQMFIKAMLYGLKGGRTGKDGTPPPQKRYQPWSGHAFSGFMEYELDNSKSFRVSRNFNTGSVKVYDGLFNDLTGSFEIARDKGILFAEKQLGMNEACFERTVFIKQMGVITEAEGNIEIINRLTNASRSGFEDISLNKALDTLKQALIRQAGTEKSSTRPLDVINSRLAELEVLRNRLIDSKNSNEDTEYRLMQAFKEKTRYETAAAELEEIKKLIDAEARLQNLKRVSLELQEIIGRTEGIQQELKAIKDRILEYDFNREKIHQFSLYNENDADQVIREFEKYNFYKGEFQKLKNELDTRKRPGIKGEITYKHKTQESLPLNSDTAKPCGRQKKEAAKTIIYSVLAAVSVIGAMVLLLEGLFTFSGRLSLAAASFAGFLLAGLFAFSAVKNHRSRLNTGISFNGKETEGDLTGIESLMMQNQKTMEQLASSLKRKFTSAGIVISDQGVLEVSHADEFVKGVREYSSLETGLEYAHLHREDLQKRLDLLYERASEICGCPVKSFFQLKEHLSRINRAEAAAIDEAASCRCIATGKCRERTDSEEQADIWSPGTDYGSSADTILSIVKLAGSDNGLAHAAWVKATGDVAARLDQLRLDIREYETLLQNVPDEGQIQLLEEEQERLLDKKEELEGLAYSLKTAISLLTEAGEEMQKDFAPALNARLGEIAGKITNKRYCNIRADKNMNLKAEAPETSDIISAPLLSGGTADQLYLAFRLALAEQFSRGSEKLPIMMDEIFAQYDEIRTVETLKFLQELSEQRQLIFLTCKTRELELAREISGGSVNVVCLQQV